MLNLKEISSIVIATLIIGITINLFKGVETLFYTILAVFCVIIINILAKKITSFYLDSEIEVGFWKVERYGFKPSQYFKKAIHAGIILPILVLIISMGTLPWYASLQSEVKPLSHKAVRRSGLLSFTEISENDLSLISAAGVASVLILSFFAYIVNLPLLSRIAIHFAFFNMLPISSLDGAKLFFGNKPLWFVLGIITLIALFYSFFLV